MEKSETVPSDLEDNESNKSNEIVVDKCSISSEKNFNENKKAISVVSNNSSKHQEFNRYYQNSSFSTCKNIQQYQPSYSYIGSEISDMNFKSQSFHRNEELSSTKDDKLLADEMYKFIIKCSKDDSHKNKSISTKSHYVKDNLSRTFYRQDSLPSFRDARNRIVKKWRLNNCTTATELDHKLSEISKMKVEDLLACEKIYWTKSAPADDFYKLTDSSIGLTKMTKRAINLCEIFKDRLVLRGERIRKEKPPYVCPMRRKKYRKHVCDIDHGSSDDDSSSSEDEESADDQNSVLKELELKRAHPDRLHRELWYNDPGEMNDGPLCRCSAKARMNGIRHNKYIGETSLPQCNLQSNNANKLFHYRITISPPTNFLIKTPTIITHQDREYIFEGFSMFSHKKLFNLPVCKVIRFNIEYTILYIEEQFPLNFSVYELELFQEFLFKEILELVDFDLRSSNSPSKYSCPQFHFMPRFVREISENGKELLPMNEVISYLLKSNNLLITNEDLEEIKTIDLKVWQNYVDEVKGMIVTYPGKKPCSIRVDQIDKEKQEDSLADSPFPVIVHFGIRPPQLSYAGNPRYQKAWREYVKFRHLVANMPKASAIEKRKLQSKEAKLFDMRTQNNMKRDVTVVISSEGFYKTGIMCDMVQHAMMLPVLVAHLRFHCSLEFLEKRMNYTFKNRSLLQLALTHPSYRENFGVNPDHARNSLTNCGIRQPKYGDRRIHYMHTRKRGINTLINIMSRFGKSSETESRITHNERLEFLGDAVVEFITSIHLFYMFPDLEEGGLATYRAAIVQNQYLAVLAKNLNLDDYMLYAHGSDLCHDLELRHAMANCFEALMGALFLDGRITVADRIFGEILWTDKTNKYRKALLKRWRNLPLHPLQVEEPNGDRHWIKRYEVLQNLTEFESSIGIKFKHIRLLARAFMDRSIGYTNLTKGSNQRLEFLGDTVLQLEASEYLYKHFPEHHEGHLSLLRSSLVNNKTQAVVCNDLGMSKFAMYANPKSELKTKDRADLLEAFLGALFVDKGVKPCKVFCNVCFFPRLRDFILNQDWNDPKSKLQQCCLTLRTMEGGEPEIPIYKVIECKGPTNTRIYTVAVYFRGCRLAQASGHSIQEAEMNAAERALERSEVLFPQLNHQKKVIAKSLKRLRPNKKGSNEVKTDSKIKNHTDSSSDDESSADNKPKIQKLDNNASNNSNNSLEDNEDSDDDAEPFTLDSLLSIVDDESLYSKDNESDDDSLFNLEYACSEN